MMTVRTWNTIYLIEDKGDGAFLISGNDRYCPVPTLVTIPYQIEVGMRFQYVYADRKHPLAYSDPITSTPVQSIEVE